MLDRPAQFEVGLTGTPYARARGRMVLMLRDKAGFWGGGSFSVESDGRRASDGCGARGLGIVGVPVLDHAR